MRHLTRMTDNYYAFIRDKKYKHISHYYEVILSKVEKAKANAKPVLSAEEMEKIYKLADQMDRMRETEPREQLQWSEEDLIDLFGKKTIH